MGFCNIRGFGGFCMVATCGLIPLLLLASTFLPWRMGLPGQGYPRSRLWSLYAIQGVRKTNYIDNYEIACHVSSRLQRYSLMLCVTPVCQWYRDKCNAWLVLLYGTYGTNIMVQLVILTGIFGCFLACRSTSLSLKILGFMHLGMIITLAIACCIYVFTSEYSFSLVNEKSVYPEPHLAFGMYMVAFVSALMMWNSCMVVNQYKMARKEELGIDTDDEWDSEDHD